MMETIATQSSREVKFIVEASKKEKRRDLGLCNFSHKVATALI